MRPANAAIRPVLLGLGIVVILVALWAAGCSGETPAPTPQTPTNTPTPSATEGPSPTMDPRYFTATAIVRRATAYAIATFTPVPTLSDEEGEELRQRWLAELETAAGFSHPGFDAYVDEVVQAASEEIASSSSWWPTRFENTALSPGIESVSYEGDTYLVVTVRKDSDHSQWNRLLMFRVRDGEPELIPNTVITSKVGRTLSLYHRQGGFMDRNGNGYPDLAIHTYLDHPVTILLEIQPGGTIANITPDISRVDEVSTFLVDLENDGVFEFGVRRCLDPYYYCLTYYYGWDGSDYVDISGSLDSSYWPQIGEFWESASDQDGCLLPTFGMEDMLLGYESRGQLDVGWARLEPALRWDECSAEQLEQYGEDMDNLIGWVGERLAETGP